MRERRAQAPSSGSLSPGLRAAAEPPPALPVAVGDHARPCDTCPHVPGTKGGHGARELGSDCRNGSPRDGCPQLRGGQGVMMGLHCVDGVVPDPPTWSSPLALSALSRQTARLRLAPTSSTRGAVPSCTREGKRRSTGRGTAGGSAWKKSSASSRASCRSQAQVKEPSLLPPHFPPLRTLPSPVPGLGRPHPAPGGTCAAWPAASCWLALAGSLQHRALRLRSHTGRPHPPARTCTQGSGAGSCPAACQPEALLSQGRAQLKESLEQPSTLCPCSTQHPGPVLLRPPQMTSAGGATAAPLGTSWATSLSPWQLP